MDDNIYERYNEMIRNEEYKESFAMEQTDNYVTDMYYLEDGTYIYVCWRYGSFTIMKIFREGKEIYSND